MQLSPQGLKRLKELISLPYDYDTVTNPNYFNGPKLVELFVEIGFRDDYDFNNEECKFRLEDKFKPKSRKDYVKHNLNILNEQNKIENIINPLLEVAGDPEQIKTSLDKIFSEERSTVSSTPTFNIAPSDKSDRIETWPFSTNDVHKRVFFSYSWDDESHLNWVLKLCNDLRNKGVDVAIDRDNRKGKDLIDFMEKGIANAHKVFIIGTQLYKQKSENDNGGVKYEQSIIKSSIFSGTDMGKFIPILRKGNFKLSFPVILSTKDGYDMSDDRNYNKVLENILHDIYENPLQPLAPVGPVPKFAATKQTV